MKITFYILLLLPAFCLAQPSNKDDDQFTIGTRKSIRSAILNEDREVWFMCLNPALIVRHTIL
ncbi:MAG: hypothetical protein JWR72_2722 [Flavisolibacter sp.]|jgi:hypothetical protein|nr:hypothetical protein [Flavisolibacter sp.]